jgi:hypothetical protein
MEPTLLLLTLLACPPKDASSLGPAVPVLPAMAAPLYAWSRGIPPDEAVARLAIGLPWDEALSGAAARLALSAVQSTPIDSAQARWAAYRAGWPYPIDEIIVQTVPSGTIPERPPGLTSTAIGVARARGAAGDSWVWLLSSPPEDLGPFRREYGLGEVLHLVSVSTSGLTARTVSPSGRRYGPAPVLDEGGEWLVEFTQGSDRWLVPLYVDSATPADAPYPHVMASPETSRTAVIQAMEVLDEYRATFDSDSLEPDPMLDKAAARALKTSLKGESLPPASERLGKLGFTGHMAELTCTAATVPECLDALYWSIDHRHDLVDPALGWAGIAASVRPTGVTLVLELAQE